MNLLKVFLLCAVLLCLQGCGDNAGAGSSAPTTQPVPTVLYPVPLPHVADVAVSDIMHGGRHFVVFSTSNYGNYNGSLFVIEVHDSAERPQ